MDYISFLSYKFLVLFGLVMLHIGLPASIWAVGAFAISVMQFVVPSRTAHWIFRAIGWPLTFAICWFLLFVDPGPNIRAGMWAEFTQSYDEYTKDREKSKPPVKTVLGQEVRRYELIQFDPPKHVYVTLRDVKSNQVLQNQYVSKHCGQHPKVNMEYNVTVERFTLSNRPGEEFVQPLNLSSTFCG